MIKSQALANRSSCVRLQGQAGQALVEFTITAMTLLVPLFFMISYVAKYHDMQAATIQAARYAAWERTVYFGESNWAAGTAQKSDSTIQNEIRNRFFSGPGSGFQSGAANPLWFDHAGAPMLESWNEASSKKQTPGTGDAVINRVTPIIAAIGKVLGADGFKLDMESLYTAKVNATPSQSGAIARIFADGGVFSLPALREQHMVVANGWSANGPDFVKKQTESLSLTSVFQRDPLAQGLSVIQGVGGIFFEELKTESLKLGGDIQVDRVPNDRVSGGNAPAPTKTKVPAKDRMNSEEGTQKGDAERDKQAFENALNKFEAERVAIDNKIKACAVAKQNEMYGNYYGIEKGEVWTTNGCSYTTEERYCSIRIIVCLQYKTRQKRVYYDCNVPYSREIIKQPPGPSYTPIFDADASCHGALDARIVQLKTDLDNEKAIKDARAACTGDQTPQCAGMNSKLAELEAKLPPLRRDRSALDVPFSSCNCQVKPGSTCTDGRTQGWGPWQITYSCQ